MKSLKLALCHWLLESGMHPLAAAVTGCPPVPMTSWNIWLGQFSEGRQLRGITDSSSLWTRRRHYLSSYLQIKNPSQGVPDEGIISTQKAADGKLPRVQEHQASPALFPGVVTPSGIQDTKPRDSSWDLTQKVKCSYPSWHLAPPGPDFRCTNTHHFRYLSSTSPVCPVYSEKGDYFHLDIVQCPQCSLGYLAITVCTYTRAGQRRYTFYLPKGPVFRVNREKRNFFMWLLWFMSMCPPPKASCSHGEQAFQRY